MKTLYHYQEKCVQYLKENKNAALFLEMRLGKSLITIRALKDLPGNKLIICPKSVIPTWVEELKADGEYDVWWANTTKYKKSNQTQWYSPDHLKWMILNYEAIPLSIGLETFAHIVVDESVMIKNPKAKITKFLLQAFPHAERKILLSGNPAPNTPLDYFTQMQFLYGGWMGCKTYWQFRHRYFANAAWTWFPRHYAKPMIKQNLDKSCYFLSRKEVGVENTKVYEKRIVEMPSLLKKKYVQMEKEFMTTLPSGGTLETKHVISQLIYLQEMASGFLKDEEISDFKICELVSLLEGELKGEQILIWCRFKWEINKVHEMLEGICTRAKISGETSLAKRKELQNLFQKKKIQVLILQVATSRHGLNLSCADTEIYLSNTFSTDDRVQSEARIESNTKTNSLLIIDIVTKDSVDTDILKALQRKEKAAGYFLNKVVDNMKERYA